MRTLNPAQQRREGDLPPMTEAELRRIADLALSHSKADQTEVLVFD